MTTPGHDPPVAEAGNDLVCLSVSRQLALSPQTGYIDHYTYAVYKKLTLMVS